MPWNVKVRAVASIRTQLSRQQADKSQFRPLADSEWQEELLPGVFYRERDRV
jgi:hypothetical protein